MSRQNLANMIWDLIGFADLRAIELPVDHTVIRNADEDFDRAGSESLLELAEENFAQHFFRAGIQGFSQKIRLALSLLHRRSHAAVVGGCLESGTRIDINRPIF